jgi:hypothetical protein
MLHEWSLRSPLPISLSWSNGQTHGDFPTLALRGVSGGVRTQLSRNSKPLSRKYAP